MKEKFMNPLADAGFKRIFGRENFMREFLNDLLCLPSKIQTITFLDKELVPKDEQKHGVVFDLYCETENKETFIVEMQYEKHKNFKERTIYYMSRSIAEQDCYETISGKHKWHYNLTPVYGVFFLNFHLDGAKRRKKRRRVQLVDILSNETFYEKMEMYFLELPQYGGMDQNECKDDIDKWLYILANMNRFENFPFKSNKPIFQQMEEVAELSSFSKEERRMYEISLDKYRTTQLAFEYREQVGYEKGRKKGREEGIKEGIKENQIETAKIMLKHGRPMEEIILFSKLTEEEILRIQ